MSITIRNFASAIAPGVEFAGKSLRAGGQILSQFIPKGQTLNPMPLIRHGIAAYPTTTYTIAWLASYWIPGYLDPKGEEVQRPMLTRFFTITVPQNITLATVIFLKYIPDLSILKDPPTLVISLVIIGGLCKVLEITRFALFWPVDKVSNLFSPGSAIKRELRNFFFPLAPRDYYAIPRA